MASDRQFDVVIWGATGFVGKIVCEKIAKKYQGEVRWAMGGRNRERLEKVREATTAFNAASKDTPILIGDITDAASLDEIAKQTKVIISLAGPFAKMGTPVVEACLRNGTHYVDITGEFWWVKKLIDEHHEEAASKGVRIVPCCGYDSIPSDLGTYFLCDHVKRQLGKEPTSVRMLTVAGSGGVSGGTVDSLIGGTSLSAEERKSIAGPYCLNPPDKRSGPDKDSYGVGYVPETGQRTFPFIMAPVNTKIVRRSNALLGDYYGRDLRYSEATPAPKPGILMAPLLTGALGLGFASLTAPGIGPFLRKRLLPAAGAGPSEAVREGNHWRNIYLATLPGESAATVQAEAYGKGDPGYGSTSRMVLEAGLTLALQLEDCEKAGRVKGGILTPASAMGPVLIDRLQRTGDFKFSISPSVGAKSKM